MTTIYVGVDPGLRSPGLVSIWPVSAIGECMDKPRYSAIDATGILGDALLCAQLREMSTEWLTTVLAPFKHAVVVMEGLAFGRDSNRSAQAGMVHEALCSAIVASSAVARVRLITVPPKVLKRYVAGSGNATKARMKKAICAKWGFTAQSQDVLEAAALAMFGYDFDTLGTLRYKVEVHDMRRGVVSHVDIDSKLSLWRGASH